MPYKVVADSGGFVVINTDTGRKHSRKPLPRKRAEAQARALYAATASEKAANYGGKVGEVIAGRLVRAAGGRFGASDAAATTADAERTIAQNRAANAAHPKVGGRKRRAAKPKKARAKKPKAAKKPKLSRQAMRTQRRQRVRQRMNHEDVAQAIGLQEDGAGALLDLAQGKRVDDDGGLEKMGLAKVQPDGTYTLTTAGQALAKAADAGDAKAARAIVEATTTKAALSNAQRRAMFAKMGKGKHARNDGRVKKARRELSFQRRAVQRGGYPGMLAAGRPASKDDMRGIRASARRAEQNYKREYADAIKYNNAHKEAPVIDPIVPAPMVFKDATGRLRWVTFSSTAFRDRDQEIVSTKALTDDVARADADGDYGPLRWWHQPGIDIGDCDFNAVTGRVLVESGTFRNEAVGERVKAAAKDLQVSIGFHHPASEPDADRVFTSIRRFERSLLPAGYASNPYTRLVVEEPNMDQAKQDALKAIVGDDLLTALLTQADSTEKAADAAGVAFKEAAPVAPDSIVVNGVTYTATISGNTVYTAATKDAPEAPAEAAEDDGPFVGDMTPDEFAGLLKTANQPYIDALSAIATAIGGQSQAVEQTATKAVAADTRLTQAETEVATLKAKLDKAEADLVELKGDLPRSLQSRRASQSDTTIVADDSRLKGADAQPHADPGFINGFVLNQPAPQGA